MELPNNNSDNTFKKDRVRRNEQIRIPQVLVIHNGKNLGVMSNRNALDLSRYYDLDLVEVSPNSRPPVCHIMDYGKFMYDRQKKQKESTSKQSQIKEKEVDFRYVIGENDLQTKVNQIRGFLEKGFKVRCVCKFRQRENIHKNHGFEVIKKVIDMVQDVGVVEYGPKLDGNRVICKIDVKKVNKIKPKDE